MNRRYSQEMRERALRMLVEARPEHPTLMAAIRHVAGMPGMSPETLRLWQRRYQVNAGVKPGVTTEAAAEIKRFRGRFPSCGKPTRSSRPRVSFSRRSSTTPRRNDPVHY